MRNRRSGHSDEALVLPGTACKELISGADFDGKHVQFELRGLIIRNFSPGTDAIVDVYDQDEVVADAASQRLSLNVPANTTAMFEFAAPGIIFYKNITAASTPITTVAAYEASAWGYEIGGK